MSTYEIDDDLIRGLIGNADLLPPRLQSGVMALKGQIPIPLPTRLGAVVQTETMILVRTAETNVQHCWWDVTNAVGWLSDEQVGKVTKVLSEGVDL